MEQSKFAEACPKLAESQRLDPGTGTLLNLALCHERVGKLATAWSEYNEARAAAERDGRADRIEFATKQLTGLGTKLSRLTIEIAPGASASSVEVRLDGVVLEPAALGVATPIDPGKHSVVATLPGKKRWAKTIRVRVDKAEAFEVVVPELQSEFASNPEPTGAEPEPIEDEVPEETKPSSPGSSQRTIGLIVGGAGVVTSGVGLFIGLKAKSRFDESESHCVGNACDKEGLAIRDDAVGRAELGSVVLGVGVLAIAGGAVLYLTAPSSPTTQIGLGLRGVNVRTTW